MKNQIEEDNLRSDWSVNTEVSDEEKEIIIKNSSIFEKINSLRKETKKSENEIIEEFRKIEHEVDGEFVKK